MDNSGVTLVTTPKRYDFEKGIIEHSVFDSWISELEHKFSIWLVWPVDQSGTI